MERLRQIRDEGLEETGAEVDPKLVFEVCKLTLSLASRVLSQYQLTVLQRSKRIWQRNFPLINRMQNQVFGTFYTTQQRLEEIDCASERILVLLFNMEEVLLDIALWWDDEQQIAKLWTKSRGIMHTTATLLSNAFGHTFHNKCTNKSIHEFISSVLALLQVYQPYDNELDVRIHEPFWGKHPIQLPSLRQIMTCGVMGMGFVTRQRMVDSLYGFVNFLQRNVWEPTQAMWIDLFSPKSTLLLGGKTELSVLEDAQQSLQRMLQEMNFTNPSQVSLAFEKEMTRPMFNALFGDLVSLALVQVQVVKIESLKLAVDLERILRDNQFNSQLLVALPSLWVAIQVVTYSYRLARYLLLPDQDFILSQRVSVMNRIRLVMWEIETLLIQEEDGPALFSNLLLLLEEEEEEEQPVEPPSRRLLLAGQLVVQVHELVYLLHQARGMLFPGDGGEFKFNKAVGDAQYLLPRAGWSAAARLSLVRALQRQVV
ncbi:hypothetical protein BASA81_003204 [Batrachochytrium salamandrivorans]|nr:hypothetical protein BASA81_003204 [Batrachochytrium salamandrivorans]